MKKQTILSVLALIAFLSFTLPAYSTVWCAGDSRKIRPSDKFEETNFFWNSRTKTVRLHSAKNEYVAFQIIVCSSNDNLSGVNIFAEDFKNNDRIISKNNIDFFKQHYLNVAVPSSVDAKPVFDAEIGQHPTQMIPFYAPKHGAPFSVEKGRNQPVWVDVYIPEDAVAGEYVSHFYITTNKTKPTRIEIILTVWDFMLPHQTHFKTYIYYGSEQIRWAFGYKNSADSKFRDLEDKFFQMAHQHRLNLCPNLELKAGYTNFDDYWYKRGRGKYISGSAYTEKVGKGIGANTWILLIDDSVFKTEYQNLAKSALAYFDKKNASAILILWVKDEPRSKKDYDFIRKRCNWAHEAVGKKLPCMVTVAIKPSSKITLKQLLKIYNFTQFKKLSWGSLIGYVDIWNSGQSSWEDMQARMAAGDKIWTYNMGWGGGPYVDTPGISGRTQAWIGWKFGFDGWHFWDSCYWTDKHNLKDKNGKRIAYQKINSNPAKYITKVWKIPMTFDQTKRPGYLASDALRLNGDGVLFYPGMGIGLEEPVSSFVMKSLRRGLQDYEYLWLAKKLGNRKNIKMIVDSIIPAPKKWNEKVDAWYEARLKLADEIINALKVK